MPKSQARRRSGHGEIVPPLSKLDRIGELLKIQVETFPQKELSSEEIGRWEQDLNRYDLAAIEWAFDEHRQLGMFFPVPAQILDLCKTWVRPQEFPEGCGPECKARHRKGYGETDILKLWNLFTAKRAAVNRELNDFEWATLLTELDKLRGGPPEWRSASN
jgi:hypothetical protein